MPRGIPNNKNKENSSASKDALKDIMGDTSSESNNNEGAHDPKIEEKTDNEAMKELVELFKKQSKEIEYLKSQVKKQTGDASTSYSQDVIEDYLDKPVQFFAYSTYYSDRGDRRNGRFVYPPNEQKRIEFQPALRYVRKGTHGSKNPEVISICQFITQSKSEVEYLTSHSKFGIKFFASAGDASKASPELHDYMIQAHALVGNLNDHMVITRCSQENIPMIEDLKVMRQKLTEKIAKKSFEEASERQKEKLKSFMKLDMSDKAAVESYINSGGSSGAASY